MDKRKAKAALIRQRVRTAKGLAKAFGEIKAARVKMKAARKPKCPSCGSRSPQNSKFCAVCGTNFSAPSPVKPQPETTLKKPILLQRLTAQLIDRILPLPFLVLIYPEWFWVVGAFHLLCEIWSGRSPGKLICRIRVVDARSLKKCGPVRGMFRRIGVALGQVAYCRWEWIWLAVAYDSISFLFVWRDRAGERIEDKLFGTRVISEGCYRKLKRQCAGCGAAVSVKARFCPHCGRK